MQRPPQSVADARRAGYNSPLALIGTLGVDDLAELRRRNPEVAQHLERALAHENAKAEKVACENSLIEFFIRAWPEIGEPGEPIINWHHIKIAQYLEALCRGEIRDLVINQPPRTTKSLLVNVILPAWIWAQPPEREGDLMGPHVKLLSVSYGATLAEDMAVKMRRLVMGEWYQKRWGDRVKINLDQAARSNFGNTNGGERYSASIEGGLLGRGGDIQVCFPASEIIWTERGPLAIGDVVEERLRLRVWSLDREEGKFELRPIIGWHRNPGRLMLRVVTASGTVCCTEDHRILTERGYVAAKELRIATDRIYAADIRGPSPDLADGGYADTVASSELCERPTRARYVANDARRDGLTGPALGIERKIKVPPTVPRTDRADDGGADPIPFCQEAGDLGAGGDLTNFLLGEVRRAVSEPAVFLAVGDVLGTRAVGQAAQGSLGAITEDMSDFLTFRTRPEERECDEPVDLAVISDAVPAERDARITFVNAAGEHFSGNGNVAASGANARKAPNLPQIGNLISGEPFDRAPALLRIDRIEVVHEIPTATYCVTVERNHNMVVGQSCICVSNCDDPHHLQGAESGVQRRQTLEAMRSLATRITDPRRSARILIMQRLHTDDATNYALVNWRNDLVHIWLPMRYDPTRPCPADERTEEGELLWPEVWDEAAVRQEEKELTYYGIAGQLQQMPVPRGGGVIKREWWRLWPDDAAGSDLGVMPARYRCIACGWDGNRVYSGAEADCPRCRASAERVIEFPETSFRILSVDTAIGDKEQNSYSAATLWGIWHGREEAPRLMLMDAWRGRPMLRSGSQTEKGLVEVITDMANKRLADVVLIEKKTRGVDLYNELQRQFRDYPWSLEFFEPTGRGDKVARLTSTQPVFTNELIWAPAKKWADMAIDEICSQPMAEFSDLTDTCTAAIIYARDTGRLSTASEHRQEQNRLRVFRGKSSRFNVRDNYEGT